MVVPRRPAALSLAMKGEFVVFRSGVIIYNERFARTSPKRLAGVLCNTYESNGTSNRLYTSLSSSKRITPANEQFESKRLAAYYSRSLMQDI